MKYGEYEEQTIKSLHLIQMDLIKEFVRICDKYDLPYWAAYGSALGAVRHKGYIPWDDDADLAMLRNDYEKFLEIAPKELDSNKYVITNFENEPDCLCAKCFICRKGTRFVLEEAKAFPDTKIFIDVFPYDNVPEDEKLRAKQVRDAWFWRKLYLLCCIPKPTLPFKKPMWKVKLVHFICSSIHYGTKLMPKLKYYCEKKYRETVFRYNGQTKLLTDLCDTNPNNWLTSMDEIFPLWETEFEDIQIKMPHGNSAMLARGYGDDCMEIPPEDKRYNHYPLVLDFGNVLEELKLNNKEN